MDSNLSSVAPLDALQPNPENLRNIDRDSFARLKKHIEMLGQHSPLLVTPEGGKLTVLGGNMRLRAIQELSTENPEKWGKVWVNVVDFMQDAETGLFNAYLNGQKQPKTFTTKKDAMMEYSLSHNDRAGYYDAEMLANIMPNYDIDWDYSVDLATPETIPELINSVAPEPKEDQTEEDTKEVICQCPSCGYRAESDKFEVKQIIDEQPVQE